MLCVYEIAMQTSNNQISAELNEWLNCLGGCPLDAIEDISIDCLKKYPQSLKGFDSRNLKAASWLEIIIICKI